MGRTSKFTFPVPGRKAKPTPLAASIPSRPMSKANKILGTSDMNTGTPPARARAKAWDVNSVSGISVTVSETTCSYADATLGLLDDSDEEEGEVLDMNGCMEEMREWEQESDILPRGLQPGDGTTVDVSDVSTVRRKRMSTSTISSFYDKSKMPLSISQQTSSSAMAKGPPLLQRSPSLRDDDSAMARKKKKPTRLDLSYLLPSRSRSSRSLVLGPDMVTKSPSLMSVATEVTPVPAKQRAERKLKKKRTSESLKGNPITEEPGHIGNPRGASDTRGLHNLYAHYEKMTFRSIMDEDIEEVDSPPLSPEDHSNAEENGKVPRETVPLIIRQPHNEAIRNACRSLGRDVPNSPSIVGGDYSASISSKYTRTSKASKRTNQSIMESDLNEKSVLSLSDDSDDEIATAAGGYGFVEPAPLSSSLSVPAERANPIVFSATESHRSPTSRSHSVKGRRRLSSGVQSARSARAASHHFLSPPPSTPPTASLPELPPTAARRVSAMSTVSANRQRSSSRASAQSCSLRGSMHKRRSKTLQSPLLSDSSQYMHRSSTTPANENDPSSHRHSSYSTLQMTNTRSSILPHQLPQFNKLSSPSIKRPNRRTSHLSSTGHPTPPLSPAGSTGSAMRPRSIESNKSGRFMAVTKQEEMLLSALRNKRKHMRESVLTDCDEGRDSISGSLRRNRDGSNASSSIKSVYSPTSPNGRRRMSLSGFSSCSSTTMDAPPVEPTHHRRRRSSLAGPPSHSTFATTAASDPTTVGPCTPAAGMNPLYKQEYYFPTSAPTPGKDSSDISAPIEASVPFTPHHQDYPVSTPQHLEPGRQDRVLLYLDDPEEDDDEDDDDDDEEGGVACVYDGEPSPDLSDFIDFDDMAAEPVTPITWPAKRGSQGSEQFSPKTVLPGGSIVSTHSQVITEEEEPIPELSQGQAEIDFGIPRPDSPISPAGFMVPLSIADQRRQNSVRLSAVGPISSSTPTSWWVDEDSIPAC